MSGLHNAARRLISAARLCLLASALLMGQGGLARAANPPRLDHFFPAGAKRGVSTAVTAAGAFETWPVRAWCSRPDVRLTAAETKGQLTLETPSDAAPGPCFIRLVDSAGASTLRPVLIGAIDELVESEPNGAPHQAQPLAVLPVLVNGRLEPRGDADLFAVTLVQGATLVAALEAQRTLGSPMDGVLQILSRDGFVLAHNDDDQGLDPRIVFRAPADGLYLVRVMAFPASPDSSIALAGGADYVYRLTLTTGAFLDHAIPLSLEQARPTDLLLRGWNLPGELARHSIVPASGVEELRLHRAEWANSLVLPVQAMPSVVIPEDPAAALELPIPCTATGIINQPGRVDRCVIKARKGQTLRVRVQAQNLGSPLDTVVRVEKPDGTRLASADDAPGGRDAELDFSVPDDGAFILAVSDLHRASGWRFVYRMTVEPLLPDYALTLNADAWIVDAGQSVEIPVSIDRRHGFPEEIELRAVALPEGVTAAAVKSAPQTESAKQLKLVLTASASAVGGPFGIVGQSLQERKLPATAEAPIAGRTQRTRHLWISVRP